MEKLETVRVNLNLPKNLVRQIDEYASSMNVNRTSAVCVLVSQAINSQKAVNDLSELLKICQNEQLKQANQEPTT